MAEGGHQIEQANDLILGPPPAGLKLVDFRLEPIKRLSLILRFVFYDTQIIKTLQIKGFPRVKNSSNSSHLWYRWPKIGKATA